MPRGNLRRPRALQVLRPLLCQARQAPPSQAALIGEPSLLLAPVFPLPPPPPYTVPNHRVGLPFEPSRTLEVAEAHIWQAYAKPNLRRRQVRGMHPTLQLRRTMRIPSLCCASMRAMSSSARRTMRAIRPALHRSVFGLPVLIPFSPWVHCWDSWCAFVDLTYTGGPILTGPRRASSAGLTWHHARRLLSAARAAVCSRAVLAATEPMPC